MTAYVRHIGAIAVLAVLATACGGLEFPDAPRDATVAVTTTEAVATTTTPTTTARPIDITNGDNYSSRFIEVPIEPIELMLIDLQERDLASTLAEYIAPESDGDVSFYLSMAQVTCDSVSSGMSSEDVVNLIEKNMYLKNLSKVSRICIMD